mgnify:FL=1
MRYLLAVAVLALVALGWGYAALQRQIAAVAESQEQVKIEAVQKAREAVSADLQGLRDAGARQRVLIERHAAEVARLKVSAADAGRQVAAVKKAGDTLRGATADTVISECARQGYSCRMAR